MQLPYDYVVDPVAKSYEFTTKNGILYRVAFVEDHTFSTISEETIENIFQIVIEKVTADKEPFDSQVSKTIESIIETFFQQVENALIFVCSDTDKRGSIRHKIFDSWYRKSSHKDRILKIDNIVSIDTGGGELFKLFTSFMFHKDNPNYPKLLQIYMQLEVVLNSVK